MFRVTDDMKLVHWLVMRGWVVVFCTATTGSGSRSHKPPLRCTIHNIHPSRANVQ